MPRESVDPDIARIFARQHSLEELEAESADLAKALLTGSVGTVNVLGMSVGINSDEARVMLRTLELARNLKLEAEDTTGVAAETALDAIAPMAPNLNFSNRRIE